MLSKRKVKHENTSNSIWVLHVLIIGIIKKPPIKKSKMETLKSLIYVSKGNLPSKMAHSIQTTKMAQAFFQKVENFELVTSGDIFSVLKGIDSEFQAWYGLHHKFKLVRLPLHIKIEYPFPQNYENFIFYKLAILYACFKAPCLIYTRSFPVVEILLRMCIPVLWEWHEPVSEKLSYTCKKLFNNKNLLGVVTTLPQLAENYLNHGLLPEKTLVAPNAVDIKNFLPYQTKSLARQKLSLQQDSQIILYSGHLYDYKGIPTILKTASLMPECEFVLVGGWIDDINRVKATCQQMNLQNIQFFGHVPQSELALYLYAADILILPTSKYWELAEATCPLKLFDYMVAKRPIVASALPTIATVLRHRENALLAEPDEPLSFKLAIETLLNNPLLAKTIADCAFQEVHNFTWDGRAERVLQFATERLQKAKKSDISYMRNVLKYITLKTISPHKLVKL